METKACANKIGSVRKSVVNYEDPYMYLEGFRKA